MSRRRSRSRRRTRRRRSRRKSRSRRRRRSRRRTRSRRRSRSRRRTLSSRQFDKLMGIASKVKSGEELSASESRSLAKYANPMRARPSLPSTSEMQRTILKHYRVLGDVHRAHRPNRVPALDCDAPITAKTFKNVLRLYYDFTNDEWRQKKNDGDWMYSVLRTLCPQKFPF